MYKYSLHKKSTKHHCPKCDKKRLVLYINNETKEYLNLKVGRCDREINCGYHYKPKQYFTDNNLDYISQFNNTKIEVIKKTSFHNNVILQKTLKNYDMNNFILSLYSKFSKTEIDTMINTYKIGTADFWYNGTIFWQIDVENKIRGGKIISYQKNGKRTRFINWVHSYLIKKNKLKNFNLKQCFFGAHLINQNNKIIAIVESEKTACIMSMLFDKYLWIAAGSLSGINLEKMEVLRKKKIVLYPDLGKNTNNKTPYILWKNKCIEFEKLGFDISISDLLENNSTEEQREKGLDIADYFMTKKQHQEFKIVRRLKSYKDEIVDVIFNKNRHFKTLVYTFGLEVVNIEKLNP